MPAALRRFEAGRELLDAYLSADGLETDSLVIAAPEVQT
jgi:hypothetical protein